MKETYISVEAMDDLLNWSGMPKEQAEKEKADFRAKYPHGAMLRTHDGENNGLTPYIPEKGSDGLSTPRGL